MQNPTDLEVKSTSFRRKFPKEYTLNVPAPEAPAREAPILGTRVKNTLIPKLNMEKVASMPRVDTGNAVEDGWPTSVAHPFPLESERSESVISELEASLKKTLIDADTTGNLGKAKQEARNTRKKGQTYTINTPRIADVEKLLVPIETSSNLISRLLNKQPLSETDTNLKSRDQVVHSASFLEEKFEKPPRIARSATASAHLWGVKLPSLETRPGSSFSNTSQFSGQRSYSSVPFVYEDFDDTDSDDDSDKQKRSNMVFPTL